MDVATSVVQAYLHLNGYFTATDYPLVESVRDASPRMLTDIDGTAYLHDPALSWLSLLNKCGMTLHHEGPEP